jgi:hypothetical protein
VNEDQKAELLYINFDLRFKYYMRKFTLYNRMVASLAKLQHHWNQIPPAVPEDELFSSLFSMVYKRLSDKDARGNNLSFIPLRERTMDVYATHFLKIIIKIL